MKAIQASRVISCHYGVNFQFFRSLSPPTSFGTDVVTNTVVHCLPIQHRVALAANTPAHALKRTRSLPFTHPSKGQSQCCVTWKILNIKASMLSYSTLC